MGKSQARRLGQAAAKFRKELRARNCRVLTAAEAARFQVMRESNYRKQEMRRAQAYKSLIAAIMLGGKSEVESKQIKHGDADKSQSKGSRFTKRFGRKSMA